MNVFRFFSRNHVLYSSAGFPHQTWFDPVIGTLHTWSCNFQVQNIYMETLTKPAKVKYPHFLTEAPNICQIFPPACSSWRLSTSIIAPPKKTSVLPHFQWNFHAASVSPVSGPGFFALSFVWIDGLGVGPRPHPCVPPGSCGSMSGS